MSEAWTLWKEKHYWWIVPHIAWLTFEAFMIQLTYYRSMAKGPGYMNKIWRPPKHNEKQVTFCKICHVWKAPRVHHCRRCGRCVLRMDHHCVWINDCVGYRNYRPFIDFLLWVVVSTTHGMIAFWLLYSELKTRRRTFLIAHRMMLVAGAAAMDTAVLCLVAFLLYGNVANCLTGVTEIEEDVIDQANYHHKGKWRFPFNLGSFGANATAFMGPNPLMWWWPAYGDMTRALKFETVAGTSPWQLTEEEMRQRHERESTKLITRAEKDYSGSLLALSEGISVAMRIPWDSAARLKFKEGEEVCVIAASGPWGYGRLKKDGATGKTGWFPLVTIDKNWQSNTRESRERKQHELEAEAQTSKKKNA
eukprot:Clim_evm77s11 gene=Clim_evmTU77s11